MYENYSLVVEGLFGASALTLPAISIGWGSHTSAVSGPGGLGVGTGRRTLEEIHVQRAIYKYTPKMELANRSGDHIAKITATIDVYQSKDGMSSSVGRIVIILNDVTVDSFRYQAGTGKTVTEATVLHAAKVDIVYHGFANQG